MTPEPAGSAPDLLPVRVRSNERLDEGLHLVALDRPFDFRPGQHVGLTLDPRAAPRLYSLASGPREEAMEILFDVHPEGALTPRLAGVRPGDTVWTTRPAGSFACDPGPGLWIAGGTGIAPFASMGRAGLAAGKTLIHGARSVAAFHGAAAFAAATGLVYRRCSSRAEGPDIERGRIPDLIARLDPRPDGPCLLCGPPEMVVAAREALFARGVAADRVRAEVYF
ncbi:MAG: oxidoreductase [Lentisphaerae bacterium]|nr:oxidoreductase [Lentisphaerota bacterium]